MEWSLCARAVGTVPMVVTILLSNIEYANTKLEHTVCESMTDWLYVR